MFVVGDALRWNQRRYRHETALVDETGSSTWDEVANRCWGLARGLLAAGVRPGDPVGVLAGNGRFSAETYLGIVAAGAVAVEYNHLWSCPELVFGVDSTHARVVLVEKQHLAAFEEAREAGLSHVETVVPQGDAYESFLQSGGPPPVAVSPTDPNVMIFTGGTTGFSKAVVLTHQNVLANSMNMIVDTRMEHSDRTLIIAPMFHSGSLLCWFVPHVVLGARSVLMRSFDEDAVADVTAREGVTNGFLVPNMVRRLLASGNFGGERYATYRRCYVGGATFKMPDKVAVRDALPGVDVYYQYGLTEAGPIVSRLLPVDMFRDDVDGSIGTEFLLTDVQLRDDDGEPVARGEVGEICVHGPNVMLGYHDRPDATADALEDGWLRTGDMATRDDEGYLYFHDRKKDMIKTGGENVYSQEVERVLYSHPAVSEAAVIGVASDEWDEEVRAVVALDEGAVLTEQDLRSYCRDQLAAYKIPKRIAFVAKHDIPINPSGKIIKSELREADLW